MNDVLQGFPFWLLDFDKSGSPTEQGTIDRLVADLAAKGISDLFVFSHGWNNDHTEAMALYDRFFAEVRNVVHVTPLKPGVVVGVAGVFWPSVLWPDDARNATMTYVMPGAGGAAVFGGGPPIPSAEATPRQIHAELAKVYNRPEQTALIEQLTGLLEKRPGSEAAIQEFQVALGELLASEGGAARDTKQPDQGESAMASLAPSRWRDLLNALGDQARQGRVPVGGAVGSGDVFGRLWDGAKDVLRVATYWHMKERAGVVGQKGLGEGVLARIATDAPATRVHLLGHSFGARLVSFALSGLPASATGLASPVKSLFLLQGAFSHYTFADKLPHDPGRSGALKGMADRVDGPLMTTHSLKDLAVARSYPAASFANGTDNASFDEQLARWAGMGYDGAQAVGATSEKLSPPGKRYAFTCGGWLNLDGNAVIVHGGLPSGAHSDIAHPHTAWASLVAAGVV